MGREEGTVREVLEGCVNGRLRLTSRLEIRISEVKIN